MGEFSFPLRNFFVVFGSRGVKEGIFLSLRCLPGWGLALDLPRAESQNLVAKSHQMLESKSLRKFRYSQG